MLMQESSKHSKSLLYIRWIIEVKRIAAWKLKKNWGSFFLFGKPPSKSSLLNISTTGQSLETTQSVLHLALADTQEYREHHLNTFHPVTPRKLIKEYWLKTLCGVSGSLHHTHGAARGVDCPGNGVLTVVYNVRLHDTLKRYTHTHT